MPASVMNDVAALEGKESEHLKHGNVVLLVNTDMAPAFGAVQGNKPILHCLWK